MTTAEHASRAGATHDEVLAAHDAGLNVWAYGEARRAGATHDGALAPRVTTPPERPGAEKA
ncbi:MAG: hypothetical protein ACYCR4_05640 [Acidimicrobiales bacterium]